MMLSDVDFFKEFIDWLMGLSIVSSEEIDDFLSCLDGVDGVIEDGFYISAFEELGRGLAKNRDLHFLEGFLKINSSFLSLRSDFLYYFVESIVDVRSALGDDVRSLISASPESYKPFLTKRFIKFPE
ncbi:hypothetical protein OU800_15525 [Pseudomonas sp. GOM7]|uniref:hypothetical protein n=1 Tax=Pseudomonas sp. GOM7 TaxID=2998079 RepID=UPI00227B340B|nr:hypothetical protein [Pseudomonas sp. GOM7]WAJ36024.1 hypothetical protein OU800_15525 [Pseudomonas sp. GOM7]